MITNACRYLKPPVVRLGGGFPAFPNFARRRADFRRSPRLSEVCLSEKTQVCENDAVAGKRAEEAAIEEREGRLAEQAGGGSKVTLANLKQDWNSDEGEPAKLNIILKADTSGSVEAIKATLGSLPQTK
eukprot:392033-Prorocentrum_minimum.AAC.1